jgi:coproporphyrinogen III oxidase-like Fe-S oxidoreductase
VDSSAMGLVLALLAPACLGSAAALRPLSPASLVHSALQLAPATGTGTCHGHPTPVCPCDIGIYLHVPFCRRRCFYCDFPIHVIGDRPSTQLQRSSSYTQLLLREIRAWRRLYNSQHGQNYKQAGDMPRAGSELTVKTIYFGGGTPSLLADHGGWTSILYLYYLILFYILYLYDTIIFI